MAPARLGNPRASRARIGRATCGRAMRLAIGALLCVACYNPNLQSGSFSCNATNNFACPEGFTCNGQLCVKMGGDGGDGGMLPPEMAGCSDGTREGLRNVTSYPDIAACDAAWDQQGIVDGTQTPHCNRQAGNTGMTANGHGCSPADVCAAGWHVCNDAADVNAHHGAVACTELAGGPSAAMYATRQRGAMLTGICAGVTTNDANNINGCGSGIGSIYLAADVCDPLNRRLRVIGGECPAPWNCGADDRVEGNNVIKAGTSLGGVLCCRD